MLKNCKKGLSKTVDKDRFENFVRIVMILITIGTFIAAIKCIFVGLQRDEEYALTLSYRLIRGDKMLSQVWDPHQTSAFLLSLIELVFIKLTGGTTYLVLWCKIIGTVIHGAIAFSLCRALCAFVPRRISFILGIIYFGILPKDGVIPEFSIMMAWFITLIIIVLIKMHLSENDNVKNGRFVFLSILLSFFSFGLILSYPTCVIVVPFVYTMLIIDKKKIPKVVLVLYPAALVLLGLLYFGYLLSYMSIDTILFNIQEALRACGSHNYEEISKGTLNLESGIALVGITALTGTVSFLIVFTYIVVLKRHSFKYFKDAFCAVCLTAIVLGAIGQVFFYTFRIFEYMHSYERAYYFWIFALAMAILIKQIKEDTSKLLFGFIIINILGFVSVVALTNLTIFTSIPYCISGVIISLLSVFLYADRKNPKLRKVVVISLLAIAFSNNYFKGITYSSNDGYNWNVLTANKFIHSGVAKGIITEYMTGYINEKAQEDWDKYIKEGDSVLVWDVTSVCYFNKDIDIASYTTISTPTYYVDSLEQYWEENPEKYPDVIAVAVWFGSDYRMKDYDHFLDWIENEYGADKVIEEDYYRYYIRRR